MSLKKEDITAHVIFAFSVAVCFGEDGRILLRPDGKPAEAIAFEFGLKVRPALQNLGDIILKAFFAALISAPLAGLKIKGKS